MGDGVACRADLCYNQGVNIVGSKDARNTLRRVTSSVLRRLVTMDTVPHSAKNGNSSLNKHFWDKVDTSGDCWLWMGCLDHKGYGRFHTTCGTGKPHHIGAHRLAYILTFGDISSDLEVCHHCDNPQCVRPDHLFLGTHAENMADQYRKGRNSPPPRNNGDAHWMRQHPERIRGENHPRAKLSLEQVRAIRASYATGKYSLQQLAVQYSMTKSGIHNIVRGTLWKGV